ncbi:hypothetical protein HZA55_05320 [Candidatus Poribacteria bacterium]|nr:hypothetical protein [Candidatus Poribacteria bacterium]
MGVISIRLEADKIKYIKELSLKEKKDKSSVIRDLLDGGWEFYWIKLYKDNKISLGTLAKKLNKSMSEMIDALADLGIESSISYEDFLEGYENLKLL